MAYSDLKKHEASAPERHVEQRWDWPTVGAAAGLSSGVVCGVFGCVFVALSWIVSDGSAYMQTIGTTLLVLMIPLLAAGAHCLDLRARRERRGRERQFE